MIWLVAVPWLSQGLGLVFCRHPLDSLHTFGWWAHVPPLEVVFQSRYPAGLPPFFGWVAACGPRVLLCRRHLDVPHPLVGLASMPWLEVVPPGKHLIVSCPFVKCAPLHHWVFLHSRTFGRGLPLEVLPFYAVFPLLCMMHHLSHPSGLAEHHPKAGDPSLKLPGTCAAPSLLGAPGVSGGQLQGCLFYGTGDNGHQGQCCHQEATVVAAQALSE